MGRHSEYTDKMADKICGLIAESPSNTMRKIASMDGLPSTATICKWLGEQEYFSEQYARAKKAQADILVEEMLLISDDGRLDRKIRTGRDGEEFEVTDSDVIQRSKLMVETRKWLAGKLRPKKYGDKQQVEHSGNMSIESVLTSGRNRSGDREKPED